MKLIDPITGGIIETFTDEATRFYTSHGYTPYLPEKPEQPKRQTRKRTAKPKEQ